MNLLIFFDIDDFKLFCNTFHKNLWRRFILQISAQWPQLGIDRSSVSDSALTEAPAIFAAPISVGAIS